MLMPELTDDQRRLYARAIMLDDFGEAAQETLLNGSVLVIGAGGLGSAVIAYLAAAGVGRIGVVDHDHVELSNLSRQIIHEYGDQGRMKIESAGDRISEINPDARVDLHSHRVTAQNAAGLIGGYDLVIDGSDNFETRFAVNAACVAARIPLISGAVKGWHGQVSSFAPHLDEHYPCYQCFVPEMPAEANNCSEVGVIGPVCGVIGSIQAMEAIKILSGCGEPLFGKLLRYDAKTQAQRVSEMNRDEQCPVCR